MTTKVPKASIFLYVAFASTVAILTSGGFALAQTAPLPQAVAIWNFDEGSGATAADSSGSGNAGTFTGAASWGDGLVGAHSMQATGRGGTVMQTAKPLLDTTQSFTVMACVRMNRVGRGFQTFVSQDGQHTSGFFLQYRGDSGEFGFAIPPYDGTWYVPNSAVSDVAPQAGAWHHVVGVYDATAHTVSLYVDGEFQDQQGAPNSWGTNGPTVVGRGRYNDRDADAANGEIDDVRLYQAALSGEQIRSIAAADLPAASLLPVTPAPIAPASLSIDAGQAKGKVSPIWLGLMTEEINHSYDGGLYAELIQNRSFQDDSTKPAHWSAVTLGDGAAGDIALDSAQPVSESLPMSLKLTVTSAGAGRRVGASNDGYWGIPVKPGTQYKASFYARSSAGFAGSLDVSIENADSSKVFATGSVSGLTDVWHKFTVDLKTSRDAGPSSGGRFVIATDTPGTVWLSLVSLFPPTYHNRANGNRIDLMDKLAALNPSFLRFPGGNYVEGNTIAERFDWKKTIGPLEDRPGHWGPWGYRSSDGLGLLEFLGWCEDLNMQPLLAVYAGYSLRGEHVDPGDALKPYVQDALDEIEYVIGDAKTTKWGAERAKDGHPAPFDLQYVEIGNEDGFDRSHSYDGRFAQFFDAIKAKYPDLQCIATAKVQSRKPDMIDDHYYRSERDFEGDVAHYDGYSRTDPKVFVGEWATESGIPTPDMNGALGDSLWMIGMQRDSDVVIMNSYAPLFVNVAQGGRQWGTNLIGYDALRSYCSPSYYAQQMFNRYLGDTILTADVQGGRHLVAGATRDTAKGRIYLKIVNASRQTQTVQIDLTGFGKIGKSAATTILAGGSAGDTNTIDDPEKISPKSGKLGLSGGKFGYTAAPYSITVLDIPAR